MTSEQMYGREPSAFMLFTNEYYFCRMVADVNIVQHERTDMFYSILFPNNKQYGEKRNYDAPKVFQGP